MSRYLLLILFLLSQPSIWAASGSEHANDCKMLKDLGNEAFNEEKYSQAMDLYTRSLELADQQGDITTYTSALGSIGNLYCLLKNYDRGAYYYNKGYKAAIEQKDERLQYIFLVNMVMSNCYAGNAENAATYWEKLKLLPTWDEVLIQYYTPVCTGSINWANGNNEEALKQHIEGLKIAQDLQLGLNYELAQHESIGLAYQGLEMLDSALVHFQFMEQHATGQGFADLKNTAYMRLADLYTLMHDDDNAHRYRQQYALMIDSIFNGPDMDVAMNRLFSYEKQANDNQVMSLHQTIDTQKIMIAIFCIMVLSLVVLTLIIVRKNRSLTDAYQLLVEKNKEQIQQLEKSRQYRALSAEDESTDPASRNPLNPEQAAKLLAEIDRAMQDPRIISSPDINLNTLAKLVDSNTRYVSWVINDTYGKNFKTYINEFRIHEASRRLADPQYRNITIAAIAEMVGFNSTNTFIQAFKKVVGMTPSVYQKMVNK